MILLIIKKSASILSDQETQMVGHDRWPATICSTEKSLLFQVRENALIAIASGFRMPRHIPIQLLLILIVKFSKDMYSGFPNFSTILWKRARLSFQSVASPSALDCLSASVLIVPGICAAATHY